MARTWIIENYEAALGRLYSAMQVEHSDDLVRAGCIQYFEFTFELAWKAIKQQAEGAGLDPGGSPKSCLKTAFAQGWLQDEAVWLAMLEARNRMSNTYHAQDALQVYLRLAGFLPALRALLTTLEKL